MTFLRMCVAAFGVCLIASVMNENVVESLERYVRGRYGEPGVAKFEKLVIAAADLLALKPVKG